MTSVSSTSVPLDRHWRICKQTLDGNYYLKKVPEYVACGEPNVWAEFQFSNAPHSIFEQQLDVRLHRHILLEASPIIQQWLNSGCFMQRVTCDEQSCKGFIKFLAFLYTKQVSDLDLFDVFGFSLTFQVPIPEETFKVALSSKNILRLLDKFPMMNTERELNYRTWILEKAEASPMDFVINSTYFFHMNRSTLYEIVQLTVGKVDKAILMRSLCKWSVTECDRQGLERSRDTALSLIPEIVKDAIGCGRPRINVYQPSQMPSLGDPPFCSGEVNGSPQNGFYPEETLAPVEASNWTGYIGENYQPDGITTADYEFTEPTYTSL